jgi:hypothetical protein
MTRKTSQSVATPATPKSSRPPDASASPRRPASAPSPSATSSAPDAGYPRPVTTETFEAEFVAYNQFRAALGQPAYTRAQFAATAARHNATIARQEDDETLPA